MCVSVWVGRWVSGCPHARARNSACSCVFYTHVSDMLRIISLREIRKSVFGIFKLFMRSMLKIKENILQWLSDRAFLSKRGEKKKRH